MSRLLCLLATILVLPWPRGELCEQSNSASRSQSTSDGSATLPTDPPVLLNDFGGSGGHSGAEYSGVGLSGNELSGEGLSGVGQSGDEQSRTGDTLSGDPFSGSGVQRAVTEGLPGNEAGGEVVIQVPFESC